MVYQNSIIDFRSLIKYFQSLRSCYSCSRLILRRHYLLAIRICDYLRIPKREGASRILAHWACQKVRSLFGLFAPIPQMFQFAKGFVSVFISHLDFEYKAKTDIRTVLISKRYFYLNN